MVGSEIGCVIGVGLENVDVVIGIEISGDVVAIVGAVMATDDGAVVIDVVVMVSAAVFVKMMGSDGDEVVIGVLVKVIFDGLLETDCVYRGVEKEIRGGVEVKVNDDDHHVDQRASEMIQN